MAFLGLRNRRPQRDNHADVFVMKTIRFRHERTAAHSSAPLDRNSIKCGPLAERSETTSDSPSHEIQDLSHGIDNPHEIAVVVLCLSSSNDLVRKQPVGDEFIIWETSQSCSRPIIKTIAYPIFTILPLSRTATAIGNYPPNDTNFMLPKLQTHLPQNVS